MEYPKNFMTTEGCSSSESGWTMYISSPMEIEDVNGQCNYDDEDDDYKHNQHTNVGFACGGYINRAVPDDGVDTDDSMASDASSGPVSRTVVANQKLDDMKKKKAGYATQIKKAGKSDKRKSGESSYKKINTEMLYSKKNCK